MRTDVKTIIVKIYNYEELSQEAKEKVKEWYLNCQEENIFTDICMENIEELFPNSNLKAQYSLSSCQGDGFNIYGNIDFKDLLNVVKDNFTKVEQDLLKEYFDYNNEYELIYNNRYCYCLINQQNIVENLIDELECEEIKYNAELVENFRKLGTEYLCKLCNEFEKNGYNYFYEISEEDMTEMCDCNNYEFTEDGMIY